MDITRWSDYQNQINYVLKGKDGEAYQEARPGADFVLIISILYFIS